MGTSRGREGQAPDATKNTGADRLYITRSSPFVGIQEI
jgi:hypothetical protein